MKHHFIKPLLITLVAVAMLTPWDVRAQDRTESGTSGNMHSVQMVVGYLDSAFLIEPSRPSLDWLQAGLRFGWIIDPGLVATYNLKGHFEAMAEITGSSITDGAGDFMGGVGAKIRYNFVNPNANVVPYVQLGAGINFNDVYKDETQGLIGQALEFSLETSIGLRFPVNNDWSVDIEGMFHHISNAGMDDRNVGVNAGGIFVGATYRFGRR